ncbi:MAG: response regulator transcription factor [Desulfotomaculaceae bacterium]|nr:response regulator transcription factor [Desulfotomaculaceae bacterium]
MTLGIVVIDDHEIFRRGLIQLLNQTEWAEVLADADNLVDGIELIKKLRPDILLLDLYINHDKKSFEAIPKIKAISPDTNVILLTVSDNEKDVFEASQYKVDGYLLKSTPFSKLEDSIQNIWKGDVLISDSLGSTLFKGLQNKYNSQSLSLREREILALIKKGMTNKDIASALFISENTVKIHVSNILKKMGVHKRTEML